MFKESLLSWQQVDVIDSNANGIADEIEPPEVDVTASVNELRTLLRLNTSCDPGICAGDVDARWDMAESSGDETAGASSTTPDQSVVDLIGEALGITYGSDEELWLVTKERERDIHRWELDPASSDDYDERMLTETDLRQRRIRDRRN